VENPNTIKRITYTGAQHLGKDELEKTTELKVGNPMSPANNLNARNALLRAYHEKGRYWTTIRLVKGNNDNDDEVVFDIAEGPVVYVRSVKFEYFGPTSGDINSPRLRTQIETSKAILGLIGGDFNPIVLDADVLKLTEYYRNLGYLKARIARELIWSDDHRAVTIVFHIEEGKRFRVSQLRIGENQKQHDKLFSYVDLHPGDYYSKAVVRADLNRLRDYYGYQGRLTQVRESVLESGDGLVDVHYEFELMNTKRDESGTARKGSGRGDSGAPVTQASNVNPAE